MYAIILPARQYGTQAADDCDRVDNVDVKVDASATAVCADAIGPSLPHFSNWSAADLWWLLATWVKMVMGTCRVAHILPPVSISACAELLSAHTPCEFLLTF